MSAVIQNEYTGNNSTTTYSFTFPYLKTSDIKASLDGVDTTAFTLPNATTLQFNTAPGSGVKIKIFRDTGVDDLTATFYAGSAIKSEDLNDNFTQNLYKTQEVGGRFISNLGGTMTGDLNMGEDTVIKFEGATDDAHETTLTVADPTADRTITLPNVTGTVVTTGDTGTVATNMIAGDAITNGLIANDQIDSEHYVDGSIDTQHIADSQITTAKIAAGAVTNNKLGADSVTNAIIADGAVRTENIADDAVTNNKIGPDAITSALIADNAINSEHYVDGSIDNVHLADDSVSNRNMVPDAINTAEIADNAVETAQLSDNSVTLAKMTDSSVGTSELVDAAVTTAKLASNAVTTAKITDANVTTAKLADSAVTTAKIAGSSITNAKLTGGSVDAGTLASNCVTTAKIASDAVTTVKIVDDAVTTAKIADSELKTLAGMQSGTASKLAAGTTLTADIADLNQIDGLTKQTTISDSDASFPTSGAVVDYVAAQIAPLGGLEVIANELSFPNTQPSSGVVISISDTGGVVVNGSGVSTTGRTVGGSTVTINGFPSSLQSKTMADDLGLMVSSTGSGQIYNYHKLLAKEADVEQLSNDINDFAARYRVGSSNPTSSLDNGDLFFNTGTGKMLVYNGTNTAWEEVQSIGNFFISTLSESFNGIRTEFTLSNAPTNAQQVILSINGVIQKPNAGTSAPSEGFALDGSTIKLASAPATGSDYFVVVMGSTVNIGTPSNNTVSSAVLQNGSVTTTKIADGAVNSAKIAADAVGSGEISDDAINSEHYVDGSIDAVHLSDGAVPESKLNVSNSPVNGYFLSAQSGNTGGMTWAQVNTSLSSDSNPTLSSNLDANGQNIVFGDSSGSSSNRLKFGTNNDLQIFHDGNSYIESSSGTTYIRQNSALHIQKIGASAKIAEFNADADVELYHAGTKRFETQSTGTLTIGNLTSNLASGTAGQGQLNLGSSGAPFIRGFDTGNHGSGSKLELISGDGDDHIVCKRNGAVELFYDATKKLETTTGGCQILNGTGDAQLNIRGGSSDGTATIQLISDDNSANSHNFRLRNAASNDFYLQNFQSGSWENNIKAVGGGSVELYHDNNKRLETSSGGIDISGATDGVVNIDTNDARGSFIRFKYNGATKAYVGCSEGFGAGTEEDIGLRSARHIYFMSGGSHKWSINTSGHLYPAANNTYDIGDSSTRVRNIYTNDLHLSNEGSSNDVDGTWGDWTIQEGESDLFLKNNRSGKKYKFNLTEVS